MNLTRPVLRYYGGKWRLAPWLISHFPPHRIYCEPFGGGASVLLQKPRSFGEVYNDLDGNVVNVFRVLRNHPRRLARLLESTPFARDEFEQGYSKVKDPVERARRTIAQSFMGFGSDSTTRPWRTGFRSNSNRSGTLPATDWSRYPPHIKAFSERLRGVIIENRDWREVVLSQDGPDTFHYLDPPYLQELRTDSHGYAHEMTAEDHRSMLDFIQSLQGMVALSAYPNELYESLCGRSWQKFTAPVRVFGNRPRTEVLWLNPSAAALRTGQSDLFSQPTGVRPSAQTTSPSAR